MPCCRRPNRRPYPPRVTQSAFAAPLLGASSNASSIGFSGSSPRCRRRNKQSSLFTSDAKCTYTICSPSMGSVRFTKTDGSLTTRTAPPWRCPRTLSPTLGSATLWRLSNVVFVAFCTHVSGASLANGFFSWRSKRKMSQEHARRLRATLNPKRVVFGWPWGGLVCN